MKELWPALWLSLQIAIVATVGVALLAIPLAWLLARRTFPGRWLLESGLLLPLVLPPTVVGYSLIMLLGARGLLGRFLYGDSGYSIVFRFEGAVLAAMTVALPMMYIPAKAAFSAVDRDLEDAAISMGASRWQLFRWVSVPLSIRGLAAGLLLAFARAIGEFGATVMVFGWQPGRVTLPVAVYAAYESGDLSAAWPGVVTLLVVSMGLIAFYGLIARRA